MIDDEIENNGEVTLRKQFSREKAEEIILEKERQSSVSLDDISPEKVKELIHELQVHQIELEMQNDELQTAHVNLKNSKKRYLDLYNKAPVGYCTISKENLILEANFIATDLLGLNCLALIKRPITDFICKEDQDIYYFYQKKFVQSNNKISCELRMINSDGAEFWASLSGISETNEDGFFYTRLVIIDITKNKKMQEEIYELNNNLKDEIARQLEEIRRKDTMLMEQATLAQLGEMITMIAHQWRQPLNAISSASVELSLLNIIGNVSADTININTKYIQKIAQDMSHTIDDFMNFNKITEDDTLNLLNVVQKTYAIVEAQLYDKDIALNIDVDNGLKIFHNERMIEHSLLNILINARDAFKEHPNIENREINIYTNEDDDAAVSLFIEDNAGGISQDIIGKIFNPYFTTKKEGEGTGLGLYMTKKMVEHISGNTLLVESKDNKTIFTIIFPVPNTP